MRALCFLAPLFVLGCKDDTTPLDDRPLGPRVHFSAIHYAEGKDHLRQLVIRGKLEVPREVLRHYPRAGRRPLLHDLRLAVD